MIGPTGNQESVQKRAEAPSPRTTTTEQLNIEATNFSDFAGIHVQAGAFGCRLYHSQRSRSASPRTLMSGRPRPP
jgi:hypothetical protein